MQAVEEIGVRPVSGRGEYELMLDYFYKADDIFLRGSTDQARRSRSRITFVAGEIQEPAAAPLKGLNADL